LTNFHDLRDEWLDRYGPLPAPAQGLLELGELRLVCIEHGVNSVVVLPARVGIRTKARRQSRATRSLVQPADAGATNARLTGLRRRTKELRVEVSNEGATPHALLELLATLVAVAEEANA